MCSVKALVAAVVLSAVFLVACFYWPMPPAPTYTLFPGQPDWYRLNATSLEPAPVDHSKITATLESPA
jgi:hypothetical protein